MATQDIRQRKTAYLHFPFLVIENPKSPLPIWSAGMSSTVLGYKSYEWKLSDHTVIQIYANGLFAFDFSKTEMKMSSKTNNFDLMSWIRTKRSQYINSYLACMHSCLIKQGSLYPGYPILSSPDKSISVDDNSAGWGGINTTSLLWKEHPSINTQDDKNTSQQPLGNHAFVMTAADFEPSRKEFEKLIKKRAAEKDYDLYFLVDYIFRAGNSFNEHHYDNSILFSWLVTEASINKLWLSNIKKLGLTNEDSKSREWTIHHKHEMLRAIGAIDRSTNDKINIARKLRNDLVHRHKSINPSNTKVDEVIKLALSLLDEAFRINLDLFLGRSLNW